VNRSLSPFYDTPKKLNSLDRRLLKGFYVSNKWELESESDEVKTVIQKVATPRRVNSKRRESIMITKGKIGKALLDLSS
jgi:hypothetical protein